MSTRKTKPDPELDLVLERVVDIPPALVWKAWTEPEHLKHWFTPKPWKTVECELDLRPGGIFRTVMESPEGQRFPGTGCILEVVPNERFTWTGALLPDFRPQHVEPDVPVFSASILLEPSGQGTKYTAHAMHKDAAGKHAHEKMGFMDGWGAALDQLVAYMKTVGVRSLLIAFALALGATSAEAQRPKKCTGQAPDTTQHGPRVYRDCEVDKPARMRGSPPRLNMQPGSSSSMREGCLHAEFEVIVDTTGRVEPTSITLVESNQRDLEQATRETLMDLHFQPAVKDGATVRQVVRYRRVAAITRSVSVSTSGGPPIGRAPVSAPRCR